MNKIVLLAFLFNLFALFATSVSKDEDAAGDMSEMGTGADQARIKEQAMIARKMFKQGLRERRSSQIENSPRNRQEKRSNSRKTKVIVQEKRKKEKRSKKNKAGNRNKKTRKNKAKKRNKIQKKPKKNKATKANKKKRKNRPSTCINNAMYFLKMKNTLAQNFQKQLKRHGRFAKITESKHGKGKNFTTDALMILNAGGGNMTELYCHDDHKNLGAKQMKSVFEELIKCEENVAKSCDYNAIVFSNTTKVGTKCIKVS